MSKSLEALEIIKNIELSHIEQSMVENYDDSYDCYYEVADDGTIEECYTEEIETIEKSLKALDIIKEKGNFISLQYDEYDDKYYIYDNELCMRNEITKEEYILLKEVLL